jgi:hypothetical protein
MKLFNDWGFVLVACLTLGLAPFVPEPHVWGKLMWVLGGAKGMALIDWFDFIMHGLPWVFLIRLLILKPIFKKENNAKESIIQ